MMVNSPFKLDAEVDYLFSSASYGPALSGWTNQRGARAVELLAGDDSVTINEALAYAVDVKPYGIERWLQALDTAVPADAPARAAADELLEWDGRLERESVPALKYGYWRLTLADHPEEAGIREAIDDHYAVVEARTPRPVELDDAQRAVLAATFADALQRMTNELGGTHAPWGRVFRVGRGKVSWPVGGGGGDRFGLTTLRTMGYDDRNERAERWGNRGQTSTQIIELSKPIESWIYLPVGQSDREGSPHYADQAEQVFSPRRLKPSWWRPDDLVGHIESRTVLDGAP
jgi:acyl-homoserine-lactone acylase